MPWFVNWDNYRTTFEIEAEKILGQPVRVEGSAEVSILPSPSLTFTDVKVGDVAGEPMMTVERFSVTIEMMPLLQGEIRVVTMTLEQPRLRVVIDERGRVNWFERTAASEALDPEKVALDGIQIRGGSLVYADRRSGIALAFDDINADVTARTLLGPWRVDGTYLEDDQRVPFGFATGLRLDDGTIRVKSNFSPPRLPFDVAADGVIGNRPGTGLMYRGTYNVAEIGTAASTAAGDFAGLRSEGSFTLTRDRLDIDKAVVSHGPPERQIAAATTLLVNFGESPSFEATVESRHVDVDRMLGGGPGEPVDVAAAGDQLATLLRSLPIPKVRGRISVNVPAVVVGGSVIQDVRLAALPTSVGWQIEGFRARLPGQAYLDADGMLATAESFGFLGTVHLSVAQPATFAAWWRGRAQQEAGRLLAAFDIAGEADIAPGRRFALDDVEARIGDATITGRFAWSESARDAHRHLGTDLKADRIDFVQVRALAELLLGRNLANTAALADSYSIIVQADAFAFEDVDMADLAINAAYSDDSLTVVQFAVGDIGGASFRVTSGRIDSVTDEPHGRLEAELNAPRLTELARIVERFAPDTGLARWLTAAAPALAPATFTARVAAPAEEGGTGFRIVLAGDAGATRFDIVADSSGNLADWRDTPAKLSAHLESPDTAGLGRQVGLAAVGFDGDAGTTVSVEGSGLPGGGLDTTIAAEIAGLRATVAGKLAVATDFTAAFTGSFDVETEYLDPLISIAGLGIPGAAVGTVVDADGTIVMGADGATLAWRSGRVGGRVVGGNVRLAPSNDRRTWRIDGNLDVDAVDLGWLMALGLGFPPMPTGDPAAPWSKTPFISPVYGPASGKLAVATDRLTLGGGVDLANARFDIMLQPQRLDVELGAAELAGGTLDGGLSIHNVAGNVSLIARFNLKAAALEAFAWRLDGRSVATGEVDLSANFEATGRSPAGLVSSATGGGAFSIRDGEARYVNPNAARLVVRASDLGQTYSEDALKLSFTEDIDAAALPFGRADGAFQIAAGAARLKNLTVRTEGLEASGNAVFDFNTLALDSDWTLTFEPGDAKVEGTDPRIGIVFRGPMSAPSRSIDVLPLASYLNMRQEVRMLEIIAMEEATRAEKERLTRLTRKLREDEARRARDAREMAQAEARRSAALRAAAEALEQLQLQREATTEQRRLAALRRFADNAVAEAVAAARAAEAAEGAAAADRQRAEAAKMVLARAIAAERGATDKAEESAAAVAEARAAAEDAEGAASRAAEVAAAAERAAPNAIAGERSARDAAERAAGAKRRADAALVAAASQSNAVETAVREADAQAAAAAEALEQATAVSAEADAALAVAEQALKKAEADLAAAQAAAEEKGKAHATALDAADAAANEQQEAVERVASAEEAVAAARAERDAARERAGAAEAEAEAADAQAQEAESVAEQAAAVAASLLGDDNPDERASAAARAMKTLTSVRATQRREAADAAKRAAVAARAHRDLAMARLTEAEQALAEAKADAAAVAESRGAAGQAAEAATAANRAAVELLAQANAVRNAAATEFSARRAAADAATQAQAEADEAARAAVAVAASARDEAGGLVDRRVAAREEADAAGEALAAANRVLADAVNARTAALAEREDTRAKAADARAAAIAAAENLAERSRAEEAAQTALAEAREALEAARHDEADAVLAARAAADATKAAGLEAQAKAAAAEAARAAVDRHAREADPFDTGSLLPAEDRQRMDAVAPESMELRPSIAVRDAPLEIGPAQ